eukprot:s3536_g10.t1
MNGKYQDPGSKSAEQHSLIPSAEDVCSDTGKDVCLDKGKVGHSALNRLLKGTDKFEKFLGDLATSECSTKPEDQAKLSGAASSVDTKGGAEGAEAKTEAVQSVGNTGDANIPENGELAPKGSSSLPSKKSSTGDFDNSDLANIFLPDKEPVPVDQCSTMTQKDRFFKSNFLIPGIALKKFAMAAQVDGVNTSDYMAVMGSHLITMYKRKKLAAQGLVMGPFSTDPQYFWQKATKHLRCKTCAAIVLFDTFNGSVEQERVLEQIPLQLKIHDCLRVLIVPAANPLGQNERDFSNVCIQVFDQNLKEITAQKPDEVDFFSCGKLGTLVGGLLHLADARDVMTAQDICKAQAEGFQKQVLLKEAQVEDKKNHLQLKRKRVSDEVDNLRESERVATAKVANLATELATWKTVWGHVCRGEEVVSKSEQQLWKDYFLAMTGNDETIQNTCPGNLCLPEMSFQEMLLEVAALVTKLSGLKAKADATLQKTSARREMLETRGKKQKDIATKKIERMTNPVIREKTLNLVSFRIF